MEDGRSKINDNFSKGLYASSSLLNKEIAS